MSAVCSRGRGGVQDASKRRGVNSWGYPRARQVMSRPFKESLDDQGIDRRLILRTQGVLPDDRRSEELEGGHSGLSKQQGPE